MAATDQQLNVRITGDASDLTSAANQAAASLEKVNKATDKVDANSAEVTVDLDTTALNAGLARADKAIDRLDAEVARPDVILDTSRMAAGQQRVEAMLASLAGGVNIQASLSSVISGSQTTVLHNVVGQQFTNLGQHAAAMMAGGLGAGLAQSMGNTLGSTMIPALSEFRKASQGTTTDLGKQATALYDVNRALHVVDDANAEYRNEMEKSGQVSQQTSEWHEHAAAALATSVGDYDRLTESIGRTTSKAGMMGSEFRRLRAQPGGMPFFSALSTARGNVDTVSHGLGTLGDSATEAGVGLGKASDGMSGIIPSVRMLGIGGGGAAAAGGIAAIGAAAVGAGIQLGQMAADVETSVIQLDALTKGATGTASGEALFGDLQEFAKDTPFELDSVTASAKRLVAAGVGLDDLNGYMTDLGELSSATGVPLEQIATIFGQMESKGRATYEELAQLAEAGLPVWDVLSEKMNMSVADVQKLATEGKLTKDAIELLRASMGEMYSGTMAKQAATYNGLMSTFRDTLTQTGQTLGTIFLPALTQGAEGLLKLAEYGLDAAEAIANLDGWMRKVGGDEALGEMGLLETFTKGGAIGTVLQGMDWMNQGLEHFGIGVEDAEEKTGSAAGGIGNDIQVLADNVVADLAEAGLAAEEFKADIETAFAGGIEIRTKVNFLISQDDIADAIRQATSGKDAVTLPADLDLKGVGGLGDKQQQIVGDLSAFVQTGLEEGARRAELDPSFDIEAWNTKIYRDVRPLAIQAGIDPTNVDAFLRRVLGIKPVIDIEANTDSAADDVRRFVLGKVEKTVPVQGDTGPANADVNSFVNKRTGKTVYVNADTTQAALEIARLTITRTVDVVANFIGGALGGGGGGGGGGGNDTGRMAGLRAAGEVLAAPGGGGYYGGGAQFYGPSAARQGPVMTTSQVTPPPVQLAPRQTPVKVFLDGQEIADKLTLRGGRLATGTGVRGRRA